MTNLLNLPPSRLKALAVISERREKLQKQIDDLTREAVKLMGLTESNPDGTDGAAGHADGHDGRQLPRARPGSIKPQILDAVRAAGKKGATVLQIVQLTGLERKTVDRWVFSHSAKNTEGFKRIAPATYTYTPPRISKKR